MATSLSLENDSSLAQGYIKVNGSTAATLTTSGITANLIGNVTGSLTAGGSLTLATAQTASGTAVDFTSIPSWAKRITVMLSDISLNATDDLLVQIGDSGGIETTGYTSGSQSSVNSTIGYIIRIGVGTRSLNGAMYISNVNSNSWISIHSGNTGTTNDVFGGGTKTLSSTLDRIRVTSVTGTSTFDAGTINISYEG
jgi:hypothetical protein